jgi:hypothetical protein
MANHETQQQPNHESNRANPEPRALLCLVQYIEPVRRLGASPLKNRDNRSANADSGQRGGQFPAVGVDGSAVDESLARHQSAADHPGQHFIGQLAKNVVIPRLQSWRHAQAVLNTSAHERYLMPTACATTTTGTPLTPPPGEGESGRCRPVSEKPTTSC